jgi:transposase
VVDDLVPELLCERVALLCPPRPPRRRCCPGRKPVDRVGLAGIVFVLKTGITWNQLPAEVIGCSA